MSVSERMACTVLSVVLATGCALSPALSPTDDEQTGSATEDGADNLSVSPSSENSAAKSSAAKLDHTSAIAVRNTDGGTQPGTSDAGLAAMLPLPSPALDAGSASTADADVVVPVADAAKPSAQPAEALVSTVSAPAAGSASRCAVPSEAALEDVSKPTTVVGSGTAASCTGSAFVAAVAKGGVITFNCGASPVIITLDQPAKVVNDASDKVVIDGGNKVTLSGAGKTRILYQNTCDESQKWTTNHCQDQEFPQLTVQNLTFADGNAKSESEASGGAIYARGGRLKILNSRFVSNVCADVGPGVGGGAVRVLSQYQNLPVYVVGSTFGGQDGSGNLCSNGGALSGLGISFSVLNSTLSYNKAIGNGANPARSGTPGGGSGGAIYNDGNTFKVSICGSLIEHNRAKEGGGSLFFVSNDRTGSLSIDSSTLSDNTGGTFDNYPSMFVLASGAPAITNSSVQ